MFGATNGGFGGFGQQSPSQASNPFGAPAQPAANPFGQPATNAFGAAAAPSFGAFGQAQAAPAFGAAPAPAFGSSTFAQAAKPSFGGFGSSAPAFGAASAPSFPAPAAQPFGAAPATGGFGASGFGAAPAPAFGTSSASSFGAAPAFGAAPTTNAFGAAPAFGAAQTTNAFAAAPASPFGGGGGGVFGAATTSPSSPFGAPAPSGGLFGAPAAGGFGQAQQQSIGTRQVAYQKTTDKEGGTNGVGGTMANLISISAMPAYNGKSQDELRWEDYQQGVKSSASGPPPPAQSNVFGAPSFGTPQATNSTFGGSPGGFGAAPAPAFGAAPAPTFGAAPAASNQFGPPAPSAFGSSTFCAAPSSGGGLFGSSSPSTFGAAPAPAFGNTTFGSSAPAFGQQPATGQSQPGVFGAPAAASSPGLFGSNTFGSAPAPAAGSGGIFGFNSSPSLFSNQAAPPAGGGLFGSTSTAAAPAGGGGLFGQPAPAPLFGQAPAQGSGAGGGLFSSTPSFGGGMFGAAPAAASKPSFSFNTSPAAAPAPAFGGGGFGFNSATTNSPGLFGTTTSPPAPAGGMFGFNSSPSLFPGAKNSFQLGGNQQQQQQQLVPSGPPPSVGQTPYGSFPSLPVVAEPKVGISARPVKNNLPPGATAGTSLVGGGSIRGSPLLSIRSTTTQGLPIPGRNNLFNPPTSQPMPYGGALSLIPASNSSISGEAHSNGGGVSLAQSAMLPARANPHRLFIRDPPPSTEAASSTPSVFTPSRPRSGRHMDDTGSRQAASPDVANRVSPQRYREAPVSHPPSSSPSSILPRLGSRLATLGYSFEPPANQLDAIYKSDPSRGLREVCNFTVIRKGVGQVRWLKPIDVTGLDLDRIISIEEGEVCCYVDEEKPPVGQGLNTDAEITLFNIFKVDKETQLPVKEGPAVLKWEKALRSMCGKMGAKFIFYKPDGGVWKFEVEHFSRYGLLDIEEDEDEEDDMIMDAAQRKAVAASKGVSAALGLSQTLLPPTPPRDKTGGARYGLGGALDEMDQGADDDEADVEYSLGPGMARGQMTRQQSTSVVMRPPFESMEDTNDTTGGESMDVFSFYPSALMDTIPFPAPSPPLQHSFPTHLNIDPGRMMSMSQSLLGPSRDLFGSSAPPSRPPWADPTSTLRAPPVHLWQAKGSSTLTLNPPLVSSLEGKVTLLDKEPASPAISPLTRPTGPSISDVTSSACYTDAGLLLGSSFRVGWGPGGMIAHPSGSSGSPWVVRTSQVSLEGTVLAFSPQGQPWDQGANLRAQRQRLKASLEVHLEHSTLDPLVILDPDSTIAPRWSLECDSKSLHDLVASFASHAEKEAARLSDLSAGLNPKPWVTSMAAATLRHESESWKLIDALYGWIEGEDDSEVTRGDDQEDDVMDEGMADEGMAPSGGSRSTLAGMRRRAAITTWLRRQSLKLVEAELSPSSLSPLDPSEAVLRLACANQASAAAAVAAAAGDVHLSSLLIQVGGGAVRSECRKEIAEQLSVWSQNDILGSIQKDRLLTYRLLAGQVDEARDRLALDWRRYLNLLLVYTTSPKASPSEAIRKLQQASLTPSSTFPRPSPAYSDVKSHSLFNQDSPSSSLSLAQSISQYHPSATDAHYELLCLWAGQQVEGAEGLGCDALSSLLQPAASSPDPLDATRPWRIMTALQAVHALPSLSVASSMSLETQSEGSEGSPSLDQVLLQVHLEAISQLRLAGGLCEWAAYVALHLPDVIPCCPSSLCRGSNDQPLGGAVRTRLVTEILVEGCQEWVKDESKRSFLAGVLKIPPRLLAQAEAIWAASIKDDSACLDALILSGQMKEALDLFSSSVGPALFLKLPSLDAEERLQFILSSLSQQDAITDLFSSHLDSMKNSADPVEEDRLADYLSRLEAANDRLQHMTYCSERQTTKLVLGRITRLLYERICSLAAPTIHLQRMLGLKSLPSDLRLAIESF